MGHQSNLYWQYEMLTGFDARANTKNEVVDELADMILGEKGYAALKEPGMTRLVRRQLQGLEPALNPYELHYNFREHFHRHFNDLLLRWLDAASRQETNAEHDDLMEGDAA